MKNIILTTACLLASACALPTKTGFEGEAAKLTGTIQTQTSDGVTIYGEPYFADLGASAPLIMLYHQGGSNGRGEYAEIAAWLNDNGYRAIAWDQRSGGETYGSENRTKAGLPADTPAGYCDASPDLQAALDYTLASKLAENVIVWGSSYSGAIIFELAANNPESIAGIIAMSPASGGPMVGCRARMWVNDVTAPILVMKPASEMERESSREQKTIMTDAGAEFIIIENGVHGSSMLLDSRTEHDMSQARADVLSWLSKTTAAQ